MIESLKSEVQSLKSCGACCVLRVASSSNGTLRYPITHHASRITHHVGVPLLVHATRNTQPVRPLTAMFVTKSTSASPSVVTNATDIRDIKPPVEIVSAWAWLWWVLAALVLAVVIFALWRWWRKRQAQALFVPPVPAHIRAKQKLAEALALIAQPKPFCIAVSDTARYYLEERFEFRAPERTTEEFLYELQRTDLLTPDQKASLGEFLQSCDLVKFAKYEPGEPELRDLHGSAVRLVEETEPVTEPAVVPAPVVNREQMLVSK